MSKKLPFVLVFAICLVSGFIFYQVIKKLQSVTLPNLQAIRVLPASTPHSLSIEALRQGNYPPSSLKIEQTLTPALNYNQYIASYKSEGLTIYGLLTVPLGEKPVSGWPVIIFNHGFIQPKEYQTTSRYTSYVDYFARNGYMVFKSDYRGHGDSEGEAKGAYGSNSYTIDVLNALASLKAYKDADPIRIGMWGHSLGGYLTLRSLVVRSDIKAAVIWAGVVVSPADIISSWNTGRFSPPSQALPAAKGWRQMLLAKYGTPDQNPAFWNSISSNAYLKDVTTPIQLHHATSDETVPYQFSQKLSEQLRQQQKLVEFYTYEGDNHNLTNSFSLAMERSLTFFNHYLKDK